MDEGKQDEANEASNVESVEDLHTTEHNRHKASDCRVFCRLTCNRLPKMRMHTNVRDDNEPMASSVTSQAKRCRDTHVGVQLQHSSLKSSRRLLQHFHGLMGGYNWAKHMHRHAL